VTQRLFLAQDGSNASATFCHCGRRVLLFCALFLTTNSAQLLPKSPGRLDIARGKFIVIVCAQMIVVWFVRRRHFKLCEFHIIADGHIIPIQCKVRPFAAWATVRNLKKYLVNVDHTLHRLLLMCWNVSEHHEHEAKIEEF
jgi:hypothetical protein